MSARHDDGTAALIAIAVVCAALASLPAAVLALLLRTFAQRSVGRWLAALAVSGLAGTLTWRAFVAELAAGWTAITRAWVASDPATAFEVAWPHVWRWWLLALPLAPAYAAAFEVLRTRGIAEVEDRRERTERRRLRRASSAAGRVAARISSQERSADDKPAADGGLVVLGGRTGGDRVLTPDRHGRVSMPGDWFERHVLVIGPSGSGKTETLLRLADGAARLGWSVYYLDAKGDPRTAARFSALLGRVGVEAAVFPSVYLDGWRGDARAIYNRLIELVPFATEGDGAYYRDVAKHALWVACNAGDGPPRSSVELLARLAPARLRQADEGKALASADAHAVGGVELRYRAFFSALSETLDGEASFEDARAAYVLLDGLRLREEAQSLARFMIEDFADFAVSRKPAGQRALLVIDEYSAVAEAGRVVELVERLRSYDVGVVLAPQVEAGMGGEAASDRVVQNTETVFLHALKRPEGIVSLAGTRWRLETSYQHDREQPTGFGSSRSQHQYRVDPNEVRALAPGECFVIRRGLAERIKIARVPDGPSDEPAVPGPEAQRSLPELGPLSGSAPGLRI